MSLLPYRGLQLLRNGLWASIWIGTAILIAVWSMPMGIAFAGLGVPLYLWARRRGWLQVSSEENGIAEDPAMIAQQARYVVTQLLKQLTRVQVAYLCQEFATDAQGLDWLKQALPRSYRGSVAELHRNLEQARSGTAAPGTELALRVVARRPEILKATEALERAHREHRQHDPAHPYIFVITEQLSSDPTSAPQVITMANWDPTKAMLLPAVDALALHTEVDKQQHVRGQAPLPSVLAAVPRSLQRVSGEPPVYATTPLEEDPAKLGLELVKIPFGFVIGTAELI